MALKDYSTPDAQFAIRQMWSRWSSGGPPSPEAIPVNQGSLLQVYEYVWAQADGNGPNLVFIDIMAHHGGDARRNAELKQLGL